MPCTRSELQGSVPTILCLQAIHRDNTALLRLQARYRWFTQRRYSVNINRQTPTLPLSPPPTTVSYVSDPFEGDIHPGTLSDLKLYILDTVNWKKEDSLSITQENVSNIIASFCHNLNSFSWGMLKNNTIEDSGNPLGTLENFQLCTLALIKQHVVKTWNYCYSNKSFPQYDDKIGDWS